MASGVKAIVKDLCPPMVWRGLSRAKRSALLQNLKPPKQGQDLDVYWTPFMAELLERWGQGNCWVDIQLLTADLHGTALDIACGTGKVMTILERPDLEIHGCDISDLLINKAIQRGLSPERLRVCDATQMPYGDREFDYSYSIGSLEHFTEDGIDKFIAEAVRVTRSASFHMMPTSRSGRDEGWMKTIQSFHNCSLSWWLPKFEKEFGRVRVMDSTWNDEISVGKWFLCYR
jgi:SAM-dependent methyltransferase